MRTLYFVILLFFFTSVVKAQWVPTNGPSFTVTSLASSGNNLYAGTVNGVYKTTNNGDSWTQINNGLSNIRVNKIAALGSKVVVISNDSNLYISNNNGSSWTNINNGLFSKKILYGLKLYGSNIYLTANGPFNGYSQDVYYSSNNGSNWINLLNYSANDNNVRDIDVQNSNILVGDSELGIWISTNNGLNWDHGNAGWISNESVHISGNDFFGGSNGLYKSTNFGSQWERLNMGPYLSYSVTSIISIGEKLFASNGEIYYSVDRGLNWNYFYQGMPAIPSYSRNLAFTNLYVFAEVLGGVVYKRALSESQLFVNQPIGGESWGGGTTQEIKWSSASNLSNVKLEYTTNNGLSWNIITSSYPANTSSFFWTIPNNFTSNQCKVRISEVGNPSINSSSLNFTINEIRLSWVQEYHGTANGGDISKSIATDKSGNVYITGSGINYVTGSDITTIKYNSQGILQWVQTYNGTSNGYDRGNYIKIDQLGNVFVSGFSSNVGTNNDMTTIKYNSEGVQQWIKIFNGSSNGPDEAFSLDLDKDGNIYITGYSSNIGTSSDMTTIKYNSEGKQQWVKFLNGTGGSFRDESKSITVDDSANIYVTGFSSSSTNRDMTTLKYNSEGIQQWIKKYNGTENSSDEAHSIAISSTYDIYITGYSFNMGTRYDYTTIKYSSTGVQLWIQNYNGTGNEDDFAYAMDIDNLGNIYITGQSKGLENHYNYDFATVKYNSLGIQQWVQRFGESNDFDYASNIVVGKFGNVFVTGVASYSNLSKILKYDSQGNFKWVEIYYAGGNQSILADSIENIYATGNFITLKYNNNNINIFNSLSISSPNGGENYITGNSNNISWSSNNVQNIKIEYTTNNSGTWSTIESSYPASSGSYAWTVPNSLSTQCKVRVSEVGGSLTDISDYPFSIVNASASITGIIKNSTTNNPVSGAKIFLTSQFNSTFFDSTNVSGYYSISNIPSGNYNIKILNQGYRTLNDNTVLLNGINNKNYSLIPDNVNMLTLVENKLKIYADNILELPSSKFKLTGNVNINGILYFSGEVGVDMNPNLSNKVVSGSGTMSAKNIKGLNYDLCSGNFSYKAIDTTLLPKDKTFLLPTTLLDNFTLKSGEISISPDGTLLKQDFIFLNLPYPFAYIFEKIGKNSPLYPKKLAGGVYYSKLNGKNFTLDISANQVVNMGLFAVSNLEFSYDSKLNRIGGKIKMRFGKAFPLGETPGNSLNNNVLVEISDKKENEVIYFDEFVNNINSSLAFNSYIEIGFEFQFVNGVVDRFIVSADNLKIPIFGSPILLDGLEGGFENFSSGKFTLIANADLSTTLNNISPLGSPIKTENAGFKIEPYDNFEFSGGTLKIFGWPVANVSLNYERNLKVLKPKGYLNLYEIVKGNFEFSLGETLNGTFKAEIKTPDDLPFGFGYFENKKLFGQEVTIFNKKISFNFEKKIGKKLYSLTFLLTFGKLTIPFFDIEPIVNIRNLDVSWRGNDNKNQIINFLVPGNSPNLYIASGSKTNAFNYTLISPSGKIFDSTYSGYMKIDSLNQTLTLIDNPQSGEWTFYTEQNGKINFEAYTANQAPTLLVENPLMKNSLSNNISLIFNDFSDSLDVDVYYDTDNKDYNGVLIKHFTIMNNASLDFLWQNSNVPNGEYYIYCNINDGKNNVVQQYAPGSIRVENNDFLITPQNISTIQVGDSLKVQWDNNGDSRIIGSKIFYKNLSNNKISQKVTIDTNLIFLTDLDYGTKYEIWVNYFDINNNEGNESNKVRTFFKNNLRNNPPCFINDNESDWIFIENENNGFSLIAEDVDNNSLTYSIIGDIPDITITRNNFKWKPQSSQVGFHQIKILVTDGILADTINKQIIVYALEQTLPKLNFSSSNLYENDNLFIKLKNFRSTNNTESVLLRNVRTLEESLVDCRRVDDFNFIGNFSLSYSRSSVINVNNGDTILALYLGENYSDTSFAVYDSTSQYTDQIPPAPITDLTAISNGLNKIKLMWTATGDNGNFGEALKYDLRYSYTPIIDESEYLTAFRYNSNLYPSAAGSIDSLVFDISELSDYLQHDTVYFSIKAEDAYQNRSSIGNSAGQSYIYAATQLQASLFDIYKININWSGVENNLLRIGGLELDGAIFGYYKLYRQLGTSPFELIADSIYQLSYMDDLFYYPDSSYKYALQAVYDIGNSETIYSEQLSLNRFSDVRVSCNTNFSGGSNDSVSVILSATDSIYAHSFFALTGPVGLVSFNNVFDSKYVIKISKQGLPEIIDTVFISDSTNTFTYNFESSINVSIAPEGFFDQQANLLILKDTVKAFLRNIVPPFTIVDSSIAILDSVTLYANFKFQNASNGTYYLVVKHRNTIETWSKSGGESFTKYSSMEFDFTSDQIKAYGSNMIQIGDKWCIYSGDINQDGIIDISDVSLIDNDAFNFASGYVATDLNGDGIVDVSDAVYADNNSFNFIGKITP